MAETEKPVRTPAALVDFGRALGRDVPASLQRTRDLAAMIRAAANPQKARPKR